GPGPGPGDAGLQPAGRGDAAGRPALRHDEQDPAGIIRAVMEPLAPGSHLALGHHTADIFPELEEFSRYLSRLNPEYTATLRRRDQVEEMFGDLELVPPGVVQISQWRPDSAYDA